MQLTLEWGGGVERDTLRQTSRGLRKKSVGRVQENLIAINGVKARVCLLWDMGDTDWIF